MSSKIIIAVAHHKPGVTVQDDMFLPIQVGAELSNLDLGIQKDNEGDNISFLNPYYCEMTAVYYLWKNCLNYDYYGLCHYRRYLTFNSPNILNRLFNLSFFWGSKLLHLWYYQARYSKQYSYPCTEDSLNKEIESFRKKILRNTNKNPSAFYCSKEVSLSTRSIYEHFAIICGFQKVDEIISIVKQDYPEYATALGNTMTGHKLFSGNITIFPKEMFNRYTAFVFGVLEKHYKISIGDINAPSNRLYARMSGYYSEFLTDAFIRREMEMGSKCYKLATLYVVSKEEKGNWYKKKWVSLLIKCGIFNVNFLR